MSPTALHRRLAEMLAPLVRAFEAVGGLALIGVGSAGEQPLERIRDLDLYLLLGEMTAARLATLRAAAGECLAPLAEASLEPWRLETRRGPFKPPPGSRQLHLLLEDLASLNETPEILLFAYAQGFPLAGEPLLGFGPPRRGPLETRWRAEAREELGRQLRGLTSRRIPYRFWSRGPRPRLLAGEKPARNAWDRFCLLHGAAKNVDLFSAATAAFSGSRPTCLRAELAALSPADLRAATRWQPIFAATAAQIAGRLRELP